MPQKRLQIALQLPVYPNSSPDHRACNSLTPFRCPHAVHPCPSVDSGLDEIEHHQIRGLPVGVIPWSLRASGLDVDWGNPSDFATAYPPMARLPSRRPGGQHLWYRETQPRRNLQQLAFPGWSGDLRSRSGYLINWAGKAGWEALLDGVIHERGVLFPADALGTASTSILEQTQGVPAPASISWERTAAGLPDLRGIMPGQRNLALFDHVRFWAYKASLGRDLGRMA